MRALKKYPMMNGHIVGNPAEKVMIPPFVNLGIAVASDSGLLVPVIKDAEVSQILSSWGNIKLDEAALNKLGDLNPNAVKLMDRVGWQ